MTLAKSSPWSLVAASLILATGVMSSSGCASRMIAAQIAAAPNRHGMPRALSNPKLLAEADAAYGAQWRVPVGPPSAEVAVAVLHPAEYALDYRVEEKQKTETQGTIHFQLNWQRLKAGAPVPALPVRGTLVLLHGFMATKEVMHPWAFYLAREGYRVVLVDLRGHGRSTGRWISYGVWEVDDLKRVLDTVERKGLLVGPVGVLGQSYGGAIGIQWASRDPRVKTVVAIAPYDEPLTLIPEFARATQPKAAARVSDADFARASVHAARKAGFEWSKTSVVEAAYQMNVPLLICHGESDTWIAPERSRRVLHAAAPGSKRVLTPHDSHESIMLRFDLLGKPVVEWFAEKLAAAPPNGGHLPGSETSQPAASAN